MKSTNRSYWQTLTLLAVLALTPGCAMLNQDASKTAILPEMGPEGAQQPAQQTAEQTAEQAAQQTAEQTAQQTAEQTAQQTAEQTAQQTPKQPAGSITMEVRPSNRRSEVRQIALTESMHIQEALEQAELTRRFKRMDLHVMRVAGDQRHKLDSKYSHKNGIVNPLYDYSLRPGDHLVVIEDPRNMFDDMLESVGGPLRALSR